VAYDDVPANGVELFRNLSNEKSLELLNELDQFLSKQDRSVNPKVKGEGRYRTGLGIYYFEEPLGDVNKQHRLISLVLLVLTGFILSACGGGISGTGDGGLIVAQTDTTATVDAPNAIADGSTDEVQDADGGDASDGAADQAPDADQLPNGIDSVVPDLSQLASTIIQTGSNATSISESLQLALNLEIIATELQQLQAEIINQQSLLYLLLENQRLTVRRIDLAQNNLFQASLIPLGNATDLVVEAVVNTNGNLRIFRSLSTTENTVTFADHNEKS